VTFILTVDDVRDVLDEAAAEWGPLADARAIVREVVVEEVVLEVTILDVRARPDGSWITVCATLDELGARREVNAFRAAQQERLARCDDVTEPWPVWRG
jgi:hypothetical protein